LKGPILIYLIDYYNKNEYGHFWTQDSYIRKAFLEQNIGFTFLNPDAEIAQREDIGLTKNKKNRYENLGKVSFSTELILDFIKKDIISSKIDKIILLFSWYPQINKNDLDSIILFSKKVELVVAGIAPVLPAIILGERSDFRYYFEKEFETFPLTRILWVWDDVDLYLNSRESDYIRRLPEYQSSIEAISNPQSQSSLSFFGMLSPFRGLAEVLIIGLFNKKLKIRIKGHGFVPWRVWRPFKNKFLRYQNWRQKPFISLFSIAISLLISALRYLPNVELSNEPFPTEKELDIAISNSQTIFYGAKLPLSSGIALKSLAAGVPVVWFGDEGEAFNFLGRKSPAGKINYVDIFRPNYIYRKVKQLENYQTSAVFEWNDYKEEICSIKNL